MFFVEEKEEKEMLFCVASSRMKGRIEINNIEGKLICHSKG